MKLKGRTAIITGSARSIGATIAKRYAAEGANVVINDRSYPELADQVVDDIKSRGGEAFFYQADVSKEAEVNAMVAETIHRYGKVDILVNNAAIDPRKVWYEITEEEWDHLMAVNVKSQFLCAKAVFPSMRAQNYGKIINVSSVTFLTGQAKFLHYVTSKGAVVGFTRALAREVGEYSINVNCITPGAVYTETELEKVGAEGLVGVDEFLAERQSFSRRMNSSDLEGAFVFLASSDSDFITGQLLNADGGWVMH
ncbi:SDR family NAD(P)-dependent oxidoreductase [Paenibacillus mendelii]|uniref:SDR family NAD(P)-dependent oxidoreductase n=1 Tax=Paenibacillus mendelii TaxID=206163 RepID=A0ABV6JLV4_9BACL|nr:3-oxoacyl-ACP reductase family protein [Paenibacillus mendelii]MCQ6562326.1 3-oxoacyl-ACP reductase FabG [Paenibacillus mendelii]